MTARDLDAADPLARYRDLFVPADGVVAYLDGNSLGRPLVRSAARIAEFVRDGWGTRLIRGWEEDWFDLPIRLGDALGAAALGAAPGQVTIGDSTTVLLYKLVRAAVDAAGPARTELVIDTDNFPTDRYVLQGVAAERGLTIRWIDSDPASGVTPEQVAGVVGPQTALVVLSHVAYRSGFLADMPQITRIAHDAGALVLWDLCHSVGVVPTELDAWGVDLAVGCSYKYLDGGPGAPAFCYVRRGLHGELRQPIWGWVGTSEPFAMGHGYEAAAGIRAFLSGTPPVLGMLAIEDMVALIAEAGLDAIRAKSIALTEHAVEFADARLAPLAVVLASPRDTASRGSHVTLRHPRFQEITARLWRRGVIPDFRTPDGLRLGLSPLSTGFEELQLGLEAIEDELT